jgi:hypothetical protein
MTRVTFYRTCFKVFMASLALSMECIRSRWQVFITCFFMALTAIVGFIIFNVVMAVQTICGIIACVYRMGEKNFTSFVLKHHPYWILRYRGGKRGIAYNSCDQKYDHNE